MTAKKGGFSGLTFHPLTAKRWDDFVELFGPRGACGGCWCMWWRLTRSEFEKKKGAGNKRAMKRIVSGGTVPGILAYSGGKAVGWCSVAPREHFPSLERSRVLKRVDDQPVWSVVCFFMPKEHRRKGLSAELLGAAVDYASRNGAKIIEGYPKEPKEGVTPDVFAWTGFASTFEKARFVEVARRSETRPLMRYFIGGRRDRGKEIQ
jgi:GNAT superfamily N-acetyltransferase